jgi:hypothetical protein
LVVAIVVLSSPIEENPKAAAEKDILAKHSRPTCPRLRTVFQSVRKDGHIRPRIVAQKSKTAYSSPKCTQTCTVWSGLRVGRMRLLSVIEFPRKLKEP